MDNLLQHQTLDELSDDLNQEGYVILGHGTGGVENQRPIISSIFQNGLRTKDNSLYYTSIGLDTDNIEKLQTYLNNWPHLSSKNIILMKFPIDFINIIGHSADLEGERYGAFYDEHLDEETGKITYYVSPKHIMGCYNSESQQIELNPKFEKELTTETLKEMKEKYINTVERTQERFKREEERSRFDRGNQNIDNSAIEDVPIEFNVLSAVSADEEWDDDWEDTKPKAM